MTASPWIFGYGSLIWRAEFPYAARRAGFIRGWARRFWQGSIDHRGLPERPGRVVTLVEQPDARCWGVGYRVEPSHFERVLFELDHRERGGYARFDVSLHFPEQAEGEPALVYVATAENPNYLGPAPLEQIAAQVLSATGPSGPNPEYVLELASSLAALSATDPHVEELAALVRAGLQVPNRERANSSRW